MKQSTAFLALLTLLFALSGCSYIGKGGEGGKGVELRSGEPGGGSGDEMAAVHSACSKGGNSGVVYRRSNSEMKQFLSYLFN